MKSMSRFFALLATIVSLGSAGAASAQSDELNCSSGLNQRMYTTGVHIGGQLVGQVPFDPDPDNAEAAVAHVQEILVTAIDRLPSTASDAIKCRAKGMLQGAVDALEAWLAEVEAACALDGEIWGEFSAVLYCELSEAFDGLTALGLLPECPATGVCGAAFESSCNTTYTDTAAALCPDFTIDPFLTVYDENRALQCTYVVP